MFNLDVRKLFAKRCRPPQIPIVCPHLEVNTNELGDEPIRITPSPQGKNPCSFCSMTISSAFSPILSWAPARIWRLQISTSPLPSTGLLKVLVDTSGMMTWLNALGTRPSAQLAAQYQSVFLPGVPPFQVATFWANALVQKDSKSTVEVRRTKSKTRDFIVSEIEW